MFVVRTGNGDDLARGASTGAAWLSSARAVRCWVKSCNERNPCLQLPSGYAGNSGGTAQDNGEEGGIASNRGSARRGEYVPGPCTHRPSHHESPLYQKSPAPTRKGGRRPRYGW